MSAPSFPKMPEHHQLWPPTWLSRDAAAECQEATPICGKDWNQLVETVELLQRELRDLTTTA